MSSIRKLTLEFLASALDLGTDGEKLVRLLPLKYVTDPTVKQIVEHVQETKTLEAKHLFLLSEAKANAGRLDRPELYLDALLIEGFAEECRTHSLKIQQAVNSSKFNDVRDLLSTPPLEVTRDDETDIATVLGGLDTATGDVISLGAQLFGLEDRWGPLLPTGVYTIAAPEGTGKSALAEQILLEASANGVPCVDFTIELAAEARALRYQQHLFGEQVGPMAFYNRYRNPLNYDVLKADKAKTNLSSLPLYIESGIENVHHMLSLAERYITRRGVKLFLVDFIQALSGDKGSDDPYTVITQAMKLIYAFARDNNVTFIVTSQMNKEGVKRIEEFKPLTNTALEGSSKIQQFSWVVTFLIKSPKDGTYSAQITKNRATGMLGAFPLDYNGKYLSFKA